MLMHLPSYLSAQRFVFVEEQDEIENLSALRVRSDPESELKRERENHVMYYYSSVEWEKKPACGLRASRRRAPPRARADHMFGRGARAVRSLRLGHSPPSQLHARPRPRSSPISCEPDQL